jgi:type II secretory pathway component PulK
MTLTDKIDEFGRPAWIVLTILGFIIWWPAGLALLAFSIWSGRMGCSRHNMERWQAKMGRMQEKMDRMRTRMQGDGGGFGFWQPPSSGNRAFDDYRAETLRRLEEEQREFQEFLARLREAKDKAEFDQFMADRRGRNGLSPQPPQGQ